MEKVTFKPGTMLNPAPVVMVSCGSETEKNIITAAWTGTVNSEPPMAYVSVRKERHSHRMIRDSGEFVINLCTEDLAFAADYCGVKSGRDVDKFEAQNLTAGKSEVVACPIIAEAPVNIECKVKEVHEYGSHDMFVGEVVNVQVDAGLIDAKGRIGLDKAGLICFNHGEYFGIKQKPIGKMGYSVMKPKTRKRLAAEKQKNK